MKKKNEHFEFLCTIVHNENYNNDNQQQQPTTIIQNVTKVNFTVTCEKRIMGIPPIEWPTISVIYLFFR